MIRPPIRPIKHQQNFQKDFRKIKKININKIFITYFHKKNNRIASNKIQRIYDKVSKRSSTKTFKQISVKFTKRISENFQHVYSGKMSNGFPYNFPNWFPQKFPSGVPQFFWNGRLQNFLRISTKKIEIDFCKKFQTDLRRNVERISSKFF